MIVEVSRGMSLIDVALQFCGDVDKVVEIAELNDIAVDCVAKGNEEWLVPDEKNVIAERIKSSGAVFCTGAVV